LRSNQKGGGKMKGKQIAILLGMRVFRAAENAAELHTLESGSLDA